MNTTDLLDLLKNDLQKIKVLRKDGKLKGFRAVARNGLHADGDTITQALDALWGKILTKK